MYKDHISETERDGDSMPKVGTLPNLGSKRRALTLVVTALAAQILSDIPFSRLARERINTKKA